MYSSTTLEGPSKSGCWKPIETCPKGKSVLLWWRPVDDNPFAEAAVIGSLPGYGHPGTDVKWWHGATGNYQDIWHVTHWMELPDMPEERKPLLEKAKSQWPKVGGVR